MGTKDHEYTRVLLDDFKAETINASRRGHPQHTRLYKRLLKTRTMTWRPQRRICPPFADIVAKIDRYIPGSNIKVINATTTMKSSWIPCQHFRGRNKLGRASRSRIFLVSYYGRNPRTPRADTVLQHARMYGYRTEDIGVTPCFSRERLADHFESYTRWKSPPGSPEKIPGRLFRGAVHTGAWTATRSQCFRPEHIGYDVEGRSYNPRNRCGPRNQGKNTDWLDDQLRNIGMPRRARHYHRRLFRVD